MRQYSIVPFRGVVRRRPTSRRRAQGAMLNVLPVLIPTHGVPHSHSAGPHRGHGSDRTGSSHAAGTRMRCRSLGAALALTTLFMLVEFAGGLLAGRWR